MVINEVAQSSVPKDGAPKNAPTDDALLVMTLLLMPKFITQKKFSLLFLGACYVLGFFVNLILEQFFSFNLFREQYPQPSVYGPFGLDVKTMAIGRCVWA